MAPCFDFTVLLRERSMAPCFALDAGPCKDANGGTLHFGVVGAGASRLAQEAAQTKASLMMYTAWNLWKRRNRRIFLAHFLRHSSSTSGDQGGGFSSEARLWRASDSLFFMIIAFLILVLGSQSLEFLLLFVITMLY